MSKQRIKLLHVPRNHPLNCLDEALKEKIRQAQTNLFHLEFALAVDVCTRAAADLRIDLDFPDDLGHQPATFIGDKTSRELVEYMVPVLRRNGIPAQAVRSQSSALAHRIQLIRAFHSPDTVIEDTCAKVAEIIAGFPRTIDAIRCGRNPGDVLDPYILAAAQQLMCAGGLESTVSATVAHKVLMMIEGLLGHLHEDVIGAMRGNVRVPEPRGDDQETFDFSRNPFPGADLLQPPLGDRALRFHQLKSKTGSAKGGDGARLGRQLKNLHDTYRGEIYYDALIGNTLRGHRSMTGVRREAPNVIVLVGDAAFRELTGSAVGAQLLLRLYQSAFEVAASRQGYCLEEIAQAIHEAFRLRAEELGDGFLETVLHDAISGPPEEQDSRHFLGLGRSGRQRNTQK
jgi:hypothetical protein